MARRKKKRGWLKTALLYILIPAIIWLVAFVVWFYWDPLVGLFSKGGENSKAVPKASRKNEQPESVPNRGREKILDEDRKQLEDILKRR